MTALVVFHCSADDNPTRTMFEEHGTRRRRIHLNHGKKISQKLITD